MGSSVNALIPHMAGENMVRCTLLIPIHWLSDLKLVVCYNFRHAEENGRGRGDPWSLRQAGVCHINDQETQQSIWLLIQQPRAISEQLSEIVLNLGGRYSRQNSIGLHTLFLSTTDQNWHSYIDHIQSTLEEVVSN